MLRLCSACASLMLVSGCVLPEASRQPTFHNPFPQLQKVAVAPFFNLSTEPTVDGRHVALAYFNELQSVPGFEVIPIGVVEKTLEAQRIELNGPAEARRLAQLLDVDAVVVGAVTDYSPYYPPRIALQVEWYAANPNFHPIPPGYGLPWGTPAEDEIPGPLVFEAEMALARAQLKTQTPRYIKSGHLAPPADQDDEPTEDGEDGDSAAPRGDLVNHEEPLPQAGETRPEPVSGLPADWPDARGFHPRGPSPVPFKTKESIEPVLRHTKTYNGNDQELTTALESYVYFRDEARFGGWQGYLQRSDDFIRFCCHMHIAEMLTARGGAGETRVVVRWPIRR